MLMNGLLRSFKPLLKRLKKYRIEIVLILIALCVSIVSVILFFQNSEKLSEESEVLGELTQPQQIPNKIRIDVAGAVKNPNVYEVKFGARVKDILDLAGGYSDEADISYISRNYNMAKLVSDQEKLYIPSFSEIQSGIFTENPKSLDYTRPLISIPPASNSLGVLLININDATLEELDSLPGVGKITAQKIIQNRPYSSVEELLSKKIVKSNVYEGLKNLVDTE